MMHDPAVVNPRQPWAVSFGVGQVFIGCLVACAIFMALIFIWLVALVPPEVLATTDPPTTVGQMTLALGGGARCSSCWSDPPWRSASAGCSAGRPTSPSTCWCSPVSYTHLRAHETRHDLVCRLLL